MEENRHDTGLLRIFILRRREKIKLSNIINNQIQ
jgi:hypothetical protein